MAYKTKAELLTEVDTYFASAKPGKILASDFRTFFGDLLDSYLPINTSSVALVKRATTQTISSNTDTPLSFSDVVFDTDSYWDISQPTRLTIPTYGFYKIVISASWEVGTAVGEWYCFIYKNGSMAPGGFSSGGNSSSSLQQTINLTSILELSSGDYIEVIVSQYTGSNKNIGVVTSAASPLFSIIKIS